MTTGDSSPGLSDHFFFSSAVCLQISPQVAKEESQEERLERSGEVTPGSPQRGCCCTVIRKGTQSPDIAQEL